MVLPHPHLPLCLIRFGIKDMLRNISSMAKKSTGNKIQVTHGSNFLILSNLPLAQNLLDIKIRHHFALLSIFLCVVKKSGKTLVKIRKIAIKF